jgi:hypothetical protein
MGLVTIERQDFEMEPVTTASSRVTPIVREHVLRWPGGGIIWRRPVALSVAAEERTYRVPIINVNLRATIAAVGIGMLFAIAIRALSGLGRSQ